MDPVGVDILTNIVAQGFVDLVKSLARLERESPDRTELVNDEADGQAAIRKAVAASFETLSEVPAIDPAIGGERLRDYFASSEAHLILRRLFITRLTEDEPESVDAIRDEFAASLAFAAAPDPSVEDAELRRLFDVLVEGVDSSLTLAIERNVLAAHDAREMLRFRRLASQLIEIRRNIALLTTAGLPDLATINRFAAEYRRLVAAREGLIAPPSLDTNERRPIDELYVAPRFEVAGAVEGSGERFVDYPAMRASIGRTVVLGDPGGGKSTFTQKLCTDVAKTGSASDADITPIRVVLRDYGAAKKQTPCSLLDFIEQTARSIYQIDAVPGRAFEYLMRNGRALVVFDGLDELLDTSYRREISADVEAFAELYESVPILVTSRRVGYEQAPLDSRRFSTYHLAEFDEGQVASYVERWFESEADFAPDERAKKVEAFVSESDVVPDLRSNPLMLGLMCNIYRGENYIPANRPDVYEKCAVMLFERWDKGRGIEVEIPFESLLRPAMQYLAHWIYSDERLQVGVTRPQLVTKATEYLYGRRFEDKDEARGAAAEFIELCKGRAWVFTDTGSKASGERLFQFTHRTFLEYFTAEYLARTNSTSEQLLNVLRPHIIRREWDVVSQVAVQIKGKQAEDSADDLLSALLDEVDKAVDDDVTNTLSFCARALEFLVPSPQVTRRVVAAVVEAAMSDTRRRAIARRTGKGPDLDHLDEINGVRVFGELLLCGSEVKVTVQRGLREQLDDAIANLPEDVSLSALELGLHLTTALTRQRGTSRIILRLQEWDALSSTIATNGSARIRLLAETSFEAAFEGFLWGALTLRELVSFHGVTSLFRERSFRAFPSMRILPVGVLLVWSTGKDRGGVDRMKRIRGSLSELGAILRSTAPPWIDRWDASFSSWMMWEDPPDFESLSGAERFALFSVLAATLETQVISQGDASNQRIHDELASLKTGSWAPVANLLLSRFEASSPGTAPLGIDAFDASDRAFLRSWSEGTTSVVATAPAEPSDDS